ncbi:hypothetical protein AALP_AA3G054300 [Arabis alpina]|uniref:Disease resistance R13L4/SHOC-2-like LRR domain-containing protein n=1 Tax=Arabis alpina TaxID=50452 RepID=A0A087H775_ARAAL|nr:hypothetical protein AALP_AA3G054300 [Arabis alpina]
MLLSKNRIVGKIPTELLQLTKLVSFDLSPSFQNALSIDGYFLPLLAQNLKSLRELDLSLVNISSKIPHELSNMSSLRLLGKLPTSLKGCTWLQVLNVGNNQINDTFPFWLSSLDSLQVLVLRSNEFHGALDHPQDAVGFPQLRIIDVSNNDFTGTLRSDYFKNWKAICLYGQLESDSSLFRLRHLRDLNLAYNNFSDSPIPADVLLMPNLQFIYLDHNDNLRGNLPDFRGNNSLIWLCVSFTSFSGTIPDSISNLKHLTVLELSNSKFSGKIPFSLGDLSHLSFLDLSYNNFLGQIPFSLGNLSSLSFLRLSENNLIGEIPSSMGNLKQLSISSLSVIYLDHNQLNDLVGIENISLLANLQHFVIGNNNYSASPIDFNVFSPLKQLTELDLSGIPLSTANITHDTEFFSNFEQLDLSDCNITEFPEFITNQKDLQKLNLCNNKIKGQVPDWLWRLPKLYNVDLSNNSLSGFKGSLEASLESEIFDVDISSNAFQGPIFIPSRSIHYYFASKNNFTGEIPQSICGLSPLFVLDLSNNNLHGSIPLCLEDQMTSLFDLNLRNNSLSGRLPDIFINAKMLRSLDVSHNRLVGKLPVSLGGCSSLEVLNVGNNQINDTFPFWLNSLQKLQVLVLHSNKFHGALDHPQVVVMGFSHLRIIDGSHNDFTGTLRSDYFTSLKAMSTIGDDTKLEYMRDGGANYYDSLVLMSKGIEMEMTRLRVLNLSSNDFTGNIPSSLENLTNLESLDLSQNKLSGEIPPDLGDLHSLEWINVSHNQLVGSIPQGTQFQRQNCSSYEGNPGLYAPSLKDICGDNLALTSQQPEPVELEEEEEEEEWFSWVAAGLGFAPGVVFGLTIGYIVVTYKHEQFTKTFGRNKRRSTRTRKAPHRSPLP